MKKYIILIIIICIPLNIIANKCYPPTITHVYEFENTINDSYENTGNESSNNLFSSTIFLYGQYSTFLTSSNSYITSPMNLFYKTIEFNFYFKNLPTTRCDVFSDGGEGGKFELYLLPNGNLCDLISGEYLTTLIPNTWYDIAISSGTESDNYTIKFYVNNILKYSYIRNIFIFGGFLIGKNFLPALVDSYYDRVIFSNTVQSSFPMGPNDCGSSIKYSKYYDEF